MSHKPTDDPKLTKSPSKPMKPYMLVLWQYDGGPAKKTEIMDPSMLIHFYIDFD